MIFLGLVLVAVAAVAAVGVLLDNSAPVTISVFGRALPGITEGELFVGGMTVAAAFILGCILVISGIRRSRRLRTELDDLRENRELYIEALEAQQAKLERELGQTRPAAATSAPADDLGTRVASADSAFFHREASA